MLHGVSDPLLPHPAAEGAVAVRLALEGEGALAGLAAPQRAFAAAQGFCGKAGQLVLCPGAEGALELALFGLGGRADAMAVRGLAARLPPAVYRIASAPEGLDAELTALAWALGSYRFDRYKKAPGQPRAELTVGAGVDLEAVRRLAHACQLARDLVNTPASDMGPLQLETVAREIAAAHGAEIAVSLGEDLLAAGYPAVHAVGRAADPARAPRMIELAWRGSEAGDAAPLVALVGKGVCFDTGGLDLKTSAGMRLMKKDMGGAAHALALGRLVMQADLPVRLVVLVPAVENAVSGDAMRPGDVLASRKGLSIEVGNTDAEGRLILADALTRAGEHAPQLTLDFATLTGAARVALGPEVPALFSDDEALAAALMAAGEAVRDPLWRLPLWPGYEEALDSEVADLKNDPDAWAQAGAVAAALFLKRFAPETGAWAHIDLMAWNPRNRPGWPAGAEAQTLRAAFALLQARYGGGARA